MYQWRKFEFFEEKKTKIPEEIEAEIGCCSNGRGRIVLGCRDGTVSLLDRGLQLNYSFPAHSASVLFIQQLKAFSSFDCLILQHLMALLLNQQRNFLVTVGEDEQLPPQKATVCLKVFDLDKRQEEGSSTSAPECIQILRIFTNQFSEAKITSFLVFEEAPPIIFIALRLDNGCIYCIQGDVARERIKRFKLEVQNGQPGKIHSPITGIGFRVDGQAFQLFAVTPSTVSLFKVEAQTPTAQTLDYIGSEAGSVAMTDRSELIIGRPEAVYFYEIDGRGPCWAFEGEKKLVGWFRDKSALLVVEKDMESKLDMLFKKNLYPVAINLVQSQQADAVATAEVLRKTFVRHTEFLDAQRIHNLTNYLEKLHEKGFASKDHTTLLLNCYTKLKDVEKLDVFIKSEDGVGEHKFDVETAIKVCRAANYHEHAMYVAKKAGRHEWYLKILLEDLDRYDEALQYINSLEPNQAGLTVKEYGKILKEHKPKQTVQILMRLCTEEGESASGGSSSFLSMLPSPVDFINIFVIHPQLLMEFLEKYTNIVKDSPAQVEIHNTLLELYLSHDLDFPSLAQTGSRENGELTADRESSAVVMSRTESNGKMQPDDASLERDRQERRQKGLVLLKNARPSEQEQPQYDVDLAIILCEMNSVNERLLYLFDCMLQEAGNSGKGGDTSLWAGLLKYFGELGEDCSREVKEVLTYVERDDILPPIFVLQTLSRNPCLTLSVIKDYVARKLELESKMIEEDRIAIEKYQDIRTNARIFQLSKCSACTFTLDLPTVHFMCMHSFHQRCLGDNGKECPECAPKYRAVSEMKRSIEQNSKSQDYFFQQVRNSKDGFSVVAEYFGPWLFFFSSETCAKKKRSRSLWISLFGLLRVGYCKGGFVIIQSLFRGLHVYVHYAWQCGPRCMLVISVVMEVAWSYTQSDVGLWLEEINLGNYREIFKENGVNGEYLEGMSMFTTEQILRFIRKCHMKWGDFITLCKELRRIKVACLKGEQKVRRPWWALACLSVVFGKAAKRNRQSRVVSLKLEP
ncbi:hypothetical protein SASPL_129933 [Salvia splendens]|uniref:Vacuolar protein sorting-associated protein 11 homolog n=1 Tax=Salvia splendens TaxID=180675 RepID=A0A8X8X6B9_SALSN|nr:hypothetical protein SASPL_129933 [Salvia splendens]